MSVNWSALHNISHEEPFAICWLAKCRQKLQEYSVNHDINQINISDVCNKIILKSNQSMLMIKDSLNDAENEREFIPLRIISQLFSGAMHIFQKQVDDLLESTENLLESINVPTTANNMRKRKLTIHYEVNSDAVLNRAQELIVDKTERINVFDSDNSNDNSIRKHDQIAIESSYRTTEEELGRFLNLSQDEQDKSSSPLIIEDIERSP